MSEQTPRDGDPIIEVRKEPLGGTKLVASHRFQRFLDLLGDTREFLNIVQSVNSLTARLGKLFGVTTRLQKDLDDVEQTSLNNDRGVLNREIQARESLEQFVNVINVNVNKLKALLSRVGGLVPIGGIIIWSGAIADIPKGFQLCNGTNGTPNLNSRFVRHADGTTFAPNATGGGLILASTGTAVGPTVSVDNDGGGSTVSVPTTGHNHITTMTEDEPFYYALAYIMRIS